MGRKSERSIRPVFGAPAKNHQQQQQQKQQITQNEKNNHTQLAS